MMTTNQIAVSGGADVEIRTLNVRMAPLTLAMLSQVQRADLIPTAWKCSGATAVICAGAPCRQQ